ncbi:winged helix-turn-helix domain-containing protein [uncultured Maribacter sp.]|uniref:winged helix-turn-helix domain-containing protein n=1 Tax=uncultured Maribacter sp. TaxID=431308 RepID=UPI00262F8B29|nr:winged helix-turn-helix domain-containing protein [uncultured Maribacter sp.]
MDYKIKSRIWIEVGGKVLLGEGRVQLLKAIDATGSLSKAAKSLSMSYKKAWELLDAINKAGAALVVIKSTGGKNGGGTVITPYGKELITAYDSVNKNCWEYLDTQIPQFPNPKNVEIISE